MTAPGSTLVKTGPHALARRTDLSAPVQAQVRALDQARARALAALENVEREVTRATDWRTLVRKHPWPTVGAAFAAGYLLGRLFRRR